MQVQSNNMREKRKTSQTTKWPRRRINPTLASRGPRLWSAVMLSCTRVSFWQRERTLSWHRCQVSSTGSYLETSRTCSSYESVEEISWHLGFSADIYIYKHVHCRNSNMSAVWGGWSKVRLIILKIDGLGDSQQIQWTQGALRLIYALRM